MFDSCSIEDGKGARRAKTDRADLSVGFCAESRAAAAEYLRGRQQLRMNLEADGGEHWSDQLPIISDQWRY
jgi:hypothetical protein